MNTEIKTTELTEDELKQYETKAAELAKTHNVSKVHPVVQINPDTLERTVCYIKEPNYMTKVLLMDKAVTLGVFAAGEKMRNICIIKEASDPITYGDHANSDEYKMGVVDYCITLIKRLTNQFKKK